MAEHSESVYLNEISFLPDLSDEEIRLLHEKLQSGDRSAYDRLSEGCLKRIVRAAQTVKPGRVPLMDLIQEGNLALLSFLSDPGDVTDDPAKSLDLAVFQAMKAALDLESEEKKAGEELSARLNVIDRVCMEIAEKEGREATVEEVAEVMKMDPADVRYLMQIALSAVKKD